MHVNRAVRYLRPALSLVCLLLGIELFVINYYSSRSSNNRQLQDEDIESTKSSLSTSLVDDQWLEVDLNHVQKSNNISTLSYGDLDSSIYHNPSNGWSSSYAYPSDCIARIDNLHALLTSHVQLTWKRVDREQACDRQEAIVALVTVNASVCQLALELREQLIETVTIFAHNQSQVTGNEGEALDLNAATLIWSPNDFIGLDPFVACFFITIHALFLNWAQMRARTVDGSEDGDRKSVSFYPHLFSLRVLADIGAPRDDFNKSSPISGIVWTVGCSKISGRLIEPIVWLENRLKQGPVLVDHLPGWNRSVFDAGTNLQVIKLTVGRLRSLHDDDIDKRFRRHVHHHSSKLIDWFTQEEGSGQEPDFDSDPNWSSQPEFPDQHRMGEKASSIAPFDITVHQITNIPIPSGALATYGYSDVRLLSLRLFIPTNANITASELERGKQSEIIFSGEVKKDLSKWISFNRDSGIIRIRPLPVHVGRHQFALCNEVQSKLVACELLTINVKAPAPFRKNYLLPIPPGTNPFSWNDQTGQICVISKLRRQLNEDIIKLMLHASDNSSGQGVEVEFRLSTNPPHLGHLVGRHVVRTRLRWPSTTNGLYTLSEIDRLNATIGQALRVRVNPDVTVQALFIYDIIQYATSNDDPYKQVYLELEWLFLPVGLTPLDRVEQPLDSLVYHRGNRNDDHGSLDNSSLTSTSRFTGLVQACTKSSLEGAEAGLRATAVSFQPFELVNVEVRPLTGSACSKLVQDQTGRIDLESAASSLMPKSGLVKFIPEVVSNFSVYDGVLFKKMIYSGKVVPRNRIRFMELFDAREVKVDDSSWIGLSKDGTYLFGLVLKSHIRAPSHFFRLDIHAVDQKTPISIGFVVSVANTFDDLTGRGQPSKALNHRIRLRIQPSSNKWTIKPSQSLDYRWHLTTSINELVQSNCFTQCHPDVVVWQLDQFENGAIYVMLSQLSILKAPVSHQQQSSCPRANISELKYMLLQQPPSHIQPSSASEQSWTSPSDLLRSRLQSVGLGLVESAAVDWLGPCLGNASEGYFGSRRIPEHSSRLDSTTSWTNFTVYPGEGFRFKIPTGLNDKSSSYFGHRLRLFDSSGHVMGSSRWIGFEEQTSTVFGIIIGNNIPSSVQEFRIASDDHSVDGVNFTVNVAGSNPKLPSKPNHRVVMQFANSLGRFSTNGHSLTDRWRLVVALDNFLRPACSDSEACQSTMDIYLLAFNYQTRGFTVIWAQKSILMKSILSTSPPTRRQLPPPDLIHTLPSNEQQLVDVWDERIRRRQQQRTRRQPSVDNPSECPEADLVNIERRLVGIGGGFQPLPSLAGHLIDAGIGKLTEVHVQRLGPCANTGSATRSSSPIPLDDLSPSTYQPASQQSRSFDADNSPTSSLNQNIAVGSSNRRMLILGLLLPICLLFICLLVAGLTYLWCSRRRRQKDQQSNGHLVANGGRKPSSKRRAADASPGIVANPDCEQMLNSSNTLIYPTCVVNATPFEDNDATGGGKLENTGHRSRVVKKQGADGDHINHTGSKPLILCNEKPPLHLPHDIGGFASHSPGVVHRQQPSVIVNTESVASQPPVQLSSPRPFCKSAAIRPNPYRNLPPPIEMGVGPMFNNTANQLPIVYAPYSRRPIPQPPPHLQSTTIRNGLG